MNSIKPLIITCGIAALLAFGSCKEDKSMFGFPERCFDVAGEPELLVNGALQLPDAQTKEFWLVNATPDARWAIDMENLDYIVSFHRGEMPFTTEELSSFSTEEWKREFESRGSISLKNGISDGRLWFFARQPDGSDLQLGDDPAEIIDGSITMRVEVVDGCDIIKVDLYCVMGDATHNYEIDVSYRYPYHYK
jgi:hypothetical protein